MERFSEDSSTYRVRESRRAKHVSIKISLLGEVEVVVPIGYDQQRIPELVKQRDNWIAETVQQLRAERQTVSPLSQETVPHQIMLRSQSECWTVRYTQTADARLRVIATADHCLQVVGPTQDQDACRQVLRRWLRNYASVHLVPWLEQVSQDVNLPFHRVTVRGQKTRWASCSSRQDISLNYKLLFLPADLVRYVFIHELCHTLQMNHAAPFWTLVEEKEPNYKQLDAELRKAWPYVPVWVEQ